MSKYSVNSTRTCYCPPLVTARQMMREKACVENAHQGLILILLKYHSHYEEKKKKGKKERSRLAPHRKCALYAPEMMCNCSLTAFKLQSCYSLPALLRRGEDMNLGVNRRSHSRSNNLYKVQ